MTDSRDWPKPPREPGDWTSETPVAPAGNTPLPPLPGPGGVSRSSAPASNPFGQSPPTAANPGPPRGQFPGLNPLTTVPVDRAPRILVAASVLVVLAVVAGAAFLLLQGGRQFPSEWDARVDPIATWVADARNLEFDHPVEVEFLTDDEYSAATAGGDSVEDVDESADADVVAQLRALGLLSGDVNLGDASDTISGSGTLAFYSPELEKVFVRGTELTPALRVTLAHELVHVLQDQNFDLERLADLDDGEGSTLRALAEGDANRVEQIYAEEALTDDERAEYEAASQGASDEAGEAFEDGAVPPVLVAVTAAPYILGPELVSYLGETGGNGAIDEALLDPPGEQVLFDPTISDTAEAEGTVLDVEVPDGAEVIEEGDTFGPTAWYLMLAARVEPTTALTAARGLGDDGFSVYRVGSQVCVRAIATGDATSDVTELAETLTAWVDQSPADVASVEVVGDEVRFESCDPGADAEAVGEITVEMLQLPVLRTQIYRELESSGADATQAACVADTLLDRVTFDEILAGYLNSQDASGVVTEITEGCR